MKAKFLPLAFVTLLSTAAFAQDYAIKLHRPEKAGNEYKLSVTAKQSQAMDMAVNGVSQKNQKKEIEAQFDGTEKILEVDAKGKETKVTLTVEKFTVTTDGASSEALPKGAVVTASMGADKKPAYEVDGKAVDPSAAQALSLVVELSKGGPTDDELFGTTDRKKKGESWTPDPAMIQKSLTETADGAVVGDVNAKFTFDDVTGDAMTVNGHVTGSVKPPLPPSFTVDQSSMDVTLKGIFPVDVNKIPPAESDESMTFSFTAHTDAPSGEKVVMKMTMSQSATRKVTAPK